MSVTEAQAILARRSDQLGLAVRQKMIRERIEQVLAGGLDDPAEAWRQYADTLDRAGEPEGGDRCRTVAALLEELGL